MAILDAPGGNANASFSTGPHDRPAKAYPWTCTNPGCPSPNQIGRIEDGCAACGSGADGIQAAPLAPTDFNCSACKGTGTVERKCGQCEGTGYEDAPQLGEPPPACGKCGGTGSIALGCGRCDGSGIDPEPAQKAIPAEVLIEAGRREMASTTPPIKIPPMPKTPLSVKAGILSPALPSIDEEPTVTSPDTVVRYRLIRYQGPADLVAKTIDNSLNGCWVEDTDVTLTAIEIAAPKAPMVQEALHLAIKRGPNWPARTKY